MSEQPVNRDAAPSSGVKDLLKLVGILVVCIVIAGAAMKLIEPLL
jgi:hypothetical protein